MSFVLIFSAASDFPASGIPTMAMIRLFIFPLIFPGFSYMSHDLAINCADRLFSVYFKENSLAPVIGQYRLGEFMEELDTFFNRLQRLIITHRIIAVSQTP